MRYPIVALAGRKGVGKSTIAKEILRLVPGAVEVSFAGPLKAFVGEYFKIPDDVLYGPSEIRDSTQFEPEEYLVGAARFHSAIKNHLPSLILANDQEAELKKALRKVQLSAKTVREVLQRVGTEVFRDILGKDIWTNIGLAAAEAALINGASLVVFSDLRFRNELLALKRFGARTAYVADHWPFVPQTNGHASELDFEKTQLVCGWFDTVIVTKHPDGKFESAQTNAFKALGPFRLMADL